MPELKKRGRPKKNLRLCPKPVDPSKSSKTKNLKMVININGVPQTVDVETSLN